MKKFTCQQAADLTGISLRRIQQMCKNHKIKGAEKSGREWLIPESFIKSQASETFTKSKKALPIGISDFKNAVTDYYYVDKTLLIKDFLDTMPKVTLFTRPRRFGKTLTMDMLRVFFEKTKEDTSVFFKDKLIWSYGKKYQQYQGKYPVIYLSFKDVKYASWEETMEKIKLLLSMECLRHKELLHGDFFETEKNYLKNIINKTATETEMTSFLLILSDMLAKHYQSQVVIIIDEYDTPIEEAHQKGYYEKIINFMRNFFSGGLKDNSNLAFGFMTGILKVAKESIFSGLNNVRINSILDDNYSQYFGFTEEEVKDILGYYDAEDKFDEVCKWYDGYQFGSTKIFNPWSVINYVMNGCKPQTFWQSTGSNDIIGEIIVNASEETIKNLHQLLMNETITAYIDTNIVFPEIHENDYTIYSFLLLAGYLTVKQIYPQDNGSFMCDLAIPNKEINYVYEKEILNRTGRTSISITLQQAIFQNAIAKIQTCLENFLTDSVSTYDGGNESFYHGMMLGLCAIVSNKYKITSNQESGLGRFDIQLCPINKNNPAFLFELKHVKKIAELEKSALLALDQIEKKQYDTQLKKEGITNIIKIGISFCGKKTCVKSITESNQ